MCCIGASCRPIRPGWNQQLNGVPMARFRNRCGAGRVRSCLEQMIAHHRMGVMMASDAQWGTVHPELRKLEAAMVRVQSEEIEQMARWYQQWFGTANH